MFEHLSGDRLKANIQHLINETGPRPAGHPAEAKARLLIETLLREHNIHDFEHIEYTTPDTWGWGTIVPVIFSLIGMILVSNPIVSSIFALLGAQQFYMASVARLNDQIFYFLYPKRPSTTLVAKIQPTCEAKKRVVLVGHLDSNKHRYTFSPQLKKSLQLGSSSILGGLLIYAVASLLGIDLVKKLATAYTSIGLVSLLLDEKDGYVDGANDNGSAVSCLMGIGRQAATTPLEHTEIWLAFTGEEEVSHNGLKALLNKHGDELRNSQFIDFELVGKGNIHYATSQRGLIGFSDYYPDDESLAIAKEAEARIEDYEVTGRDMPILDEVGTLRRLGFRAIGLDGVGEDGYPANWHQYSDTVENIDEHSLETAAHFAWEMIQIIDEKAAKSN